MAGRKKRRASMTRRELAAGGDEGDEGGDGNEGGEGGDAARRGGEQSTEQTTASGLHETIEQEDERGEEDGVAHEEDAGGHGDAESLGHLLVDMTAQVQAERGKRRAAETRSEALLRELDQLQQEVLALRTASRVRQAESDEAEESAQAKPSADADADVSESRTELLEAKRAAEKALREAHQRALQVQELHACVSMQHDELSALRSSAQADRDARAASDAAARGLRQERQVLQQEAALLRDGSAQLQREMGKRGAHFKALLEKWTEAQAQSEHRERETAALREQLQAARRRAEACERERETLRDERDALQRQQHQLKGAVAAKTAESRAFQAYGASAREHVQAQRAAAQRHAVYRRQVHSVARDAVSSVRGLRASLLLTRAPLLALQAEVTRSLLQLRAPVLALVARATRFARVAQAELAPLRLALRSAELARRHLHEQLWRSRRDALLVCQLQAAGSGEECLVDTAGPRGADADADAGEGDAGGPRLLLRANFAARELLLCGARDAAPSVRCDALLSDRAPEWSGHESVTPLLQAVLDGRNACVATFVGAPPLRVAGRRPPTSAASRPHRSVAELLVRELFAAVRLAAGGDARCQRAKLTLSFLAVHGEVVYDLLGLETDASDASDGSAPRHMVVLDVDDAEEALLVLAGGRERLTDASGPSRVRPGASRLPRASTHTVVTLGVSYESLLVDAAPVQAKLQLVELALPRTQDVAGAGLAGSRPPRAKAEELQQRVAMENGAAALVAALAEVRLPDAGFVRYHSSKLTVLLQDTVKAGAKFLALVALPAARGGEGECECECDPVAVLRVLQQLRVAVSGGASGGADVDAVTRARSLEGFMNRLVLQQAQAGGDVDAPRLRFSSLDMQELARQRREMTHTDCWDSELERMTRRYGRDALEALEAPPAVEGQVATASGGHRRVEIAQEQAAAVVHPLARSTSQPPPAPGTAVRKPKLLRRGSKSVRGGNATVAGPGRRRAATETPSALANRKRQSAAILMPTTVRTGRAAEVTTLASAPPPKSTLAAVFQIRRETASSALKKALLASAAAAKQQTKRTPFR